jgi:hypothetical protein
MMCHAGVKRGGGEFGFGAGRGGGATLEIFFGGCATDPSAPNAVVMHAIRFATGVPPLRAAMHFAPLEEFSPALRSG